MNQAQENFRKLQQQLQKLAFLRSSANDGDKLLENLLDLVYHLMDRLGWPDKEWGLETQSKRFPGHFHRSDSKEIQPSGLVVKARILGRDLEIPIRVDIAPQSGGGRQLYINNRPVGSILDGGEAWTISDPLLDVVRNQIIELALAVQEQNTKGT